MLLKSTKYLKNWEYKFNFHIKGNYMTKLAISGGEKIRKKYFPGQNNIGEEEKEAVMKVLNTGCLSGYRGNWSEAFYGGPEVRSLEKEFSEKFHIPHVIACNSCTSALHIACKAIDLTLGDEVIVTPWSMSCSASAPALWDAFPIFADIEEDYFCLNSKSVSKYISPSVKAIIVVDLFGQPYDKQEINELAEEYDLTIIEDAAQAIGSMYDKQYAGSLGHIGVFSFTQGKILHSGEGGIIATKNGHLAMKCRLIMNHAEAVIHGMPSITLNLNAINDALFGFNMRMTELQAAVLRPQLKNLEKILEMRRKNASKIKEMLEQIPAIKAAPIRKDCTHSYYVQAFKWDKSKADNIHRDIFIKAVQAELTPEEGRLDKSLLNNGYLEPLYTFPFFKNLREEYTFKTLAPQKTLAVVDDLQRNKLFISLFHGLPLSHKDLNDIGRAFNKVWENRSELIQ